MHAAGEWADTIPSRSTAVTRLRVRDLVITVSVNLIYIAGTGRCGSTLLEMLLGAHSRIRTMGELHSWPYDVMDGRARQCGCGSLMADCPFWSEMCRRVDPLDQPHPRLHVFREARTHGAALRPRIVSEGMRRQLEPAAARDIDQYGRNNDAVFRAFVELSRERDGYAPAWIVDASKDPYRMLWLLRSGHVNLRVLHAVRDPRGFISSSIRLAGDEGRLPRMVFHHAMRKSVLWGYLNRQIAQMCARFLPAASYTIVRYEDLAMRPHAVLEPIVRSLGLAFEPGVVAGFRNGSHAVAGNPMRHDRRGIEIDETWKQSLPAICRVIAQAMTLPIRGRFGY